MCREDIFQDICTAFGIVFYSSTRFGAVSRRPNKPFGMFWLRLSGRSHSALRAALVARGWTVLNAHNPKCTAAE